LRGAPRCDPRQGRQPAVADDVGDQDRSDFPGFGHGAPSRVTQSKKGLSRASTYRKAIGPKELKSLRACEAPNRELDCGEGDEGGADIGEFFAAGAAAAGS